MLNSGTKRWVHLPKDWRNIEEVSRTFGLHPAIAAIVLQRDLQGDEAIAHFLDPSLAHLPSPMLMKDMDRAAGVLADAVTARHPVVIFGDYDADGITGAAVLFLFLQELGIDAQVVLPDRLLDGYGLQTGTIDRIRTLLPAGRGEGAVLVTVDCGISSFDAIEKAKEAGFRVVITDHHLPGERLPDADAVLNPLRDDCPFPFKQLAGVGVVFYLLMGLRLVLRERGYWQKEGREPLLKKYLDLVALGTISDMMPLLGVNRVLVKTGLDVLTAGGRPGVSTLCRIAGLPPGEEVTAENIAFRLGPRLNAAGRVGAPEKAFRLLVTDSMSEAREIAEALDQDNQTRKEYSESLYNECSTLASGMVQQGLSSIVLAGKGWHPGILGIVAARLVNEFSRPVILFSIPNDGVAKGSGRSLPGLDLHGILADCAHLLTRFGGHSIAAGLAAEPANIPVFAELFETMVCARVGAEELVPSLSIDWLLLQDEFSEPSFFSGLKKLAPHGVGNPEPLFAAQGCQMKTCSQLGENHLRFEWQQKGVVLPGIGFGWGGFSRQLKDRDADFAFLIREDTYRGRRRWQLHLQDIQFADTTGGGETA